MASGEVRLQPPPILIYSWRRDRDARSFSRLARDLRSPCTIRRLYLHDDLRVRCCRPGYPHYVRRNHRAKHCLYHPCAACHAPFQLCAIFYHPAVLSGGHGDTAAEIGVRGHSRARELKKRLEQRNL